MHVGWFLRSAAIRRTTQFFLWILSLQWLGPRDQATPQILEAHGLELCRHRQRSGGLALLREAPRRIVQPICGS